VDHAGRVAEHADAGRVERAQRRPAREVRQRVVRRIGTTSRTSTPRRAATAIARSSASSGTK